MKIYVAARFEKKDIVRKLYEKLIKIGHKISVDWTSHEPIKPYEKNHKTSSNYSIEDINGVKSCDVMILLSD